MLSVNGPGLPLQLTVSIPFDLDIEMLFPQHQTLAFPAYALLEQEQLDVGVEVEIMLHPGSEKGPWPSAHLQTPPPELTKLLQQ